MKKITKRTVQRSSKPKAEDENYFSMSAKCFVRAFLFLTLGVWNFAKRIYDRLPKIAVLTISFMLVTLLFVAWLITYANFKTRLTTLIWQRDSLQLKIDSINELHSNTVEYSRFERK